MSSENGVVVTLAALAMLLTAVSPATAGRGGGGGATKYKSTVEISFIDSDDGDDYFGAAVRSDPRAGGSQSCLGPRAIKLFRGRPGSGQLLGKFDGTLRTGP